MRNLSNDKSITETLKIIRKALQEDNLDNNNENVLVLNQLVKNDGTIASINIDNNNKNEIKNFISELFEQYFENWLNKNLPTYLEKYFSNKDK